jgi:hypothetical protein
VLRNPARGNHLHVLVHQPPGAEPASGKVAKNPVDLCVLAPPGKKRSRMSHTA